MKPKFVVVGAIALAVATGCAAASRDRRWLEKAAVERTGHHIGPSEQDPEHPLPDGCNVRDGLDPDEAVAIALWRSPFLKAELTNLDTAFANFDESRRLPNPRLSLLAPIDPRQLAVILAWPIDALWQVPLRTEAANLELERVAESLVQYVLDTERDLRTAHAEARVARSRIDVLEDVAEWWKQAAEVADERVALGDIAAAEAAPIRAEAVLAADAIARARRDSEVADARLAMMMGKPFESLPVLVPPPSRKDALPAEAALVHDAYRSRPDLKAAELAVHAAAARARWERSRVVSFVATLDGQALRGELTPHFSPGAQVELPIFSQNQGGVGRADAEIARAGHLYRAARLTVSLEITSARAAVEKASGSMNAYDSVLAALAEATLAAKNAFESGAESYLVVIDALRREADARLRHIELDAELARSEAMLARALGGSIRKETT